MKIDPNSGFYSFTKINLLLHSLIENLTNFRAWKWMSQTTRSGGRKYILYINQLSSILLACQVFISNFKSKNYRSSRHLASLGSWTPLPIRRCLQGTKTVTPFANPLQCSASYLSTRLHYFFPTYLGRSRYNHILFSQMSKLGDATFLF